MPINRYVLVKFSDFWLLRYDLWHSIHSGIWICRFKVNYFFFLFEDIDECKDGSAMCDSESTICVNLVPSYKCICKIGYTTMYYSDSTPDAYNCKGTGVKNTFFLCVGKIPSHWTFHCSLVVPSIFRTSLCPETSA